LSSARIGSAPQLEPPLPPAFYCFRHSSSTCEDTGTTANQMVLYGHGS